MVKFKMFKKSSPFPGQVRIFDHTAVHTAAHIFDHNMIPISLWTSPSSSQCQRVFVGSLFFQLPLWEVTGQIKLQGP